MNARDLHCKYGSASGDRDRRRRRAGSLSIAILIALALLCNHGSARAGQAPASPAADSRLAAHFLEQATFGPTAADVARVQTVGAAVWLNEQFGLPESQILDGLDSTQTRNQLFFNMANGADQVRQRMMFALSQTIVVSANKNSSGSQLIPWVRLLSRNAFGNYRTLLRDITVSPTMGKYLDLAYSKKASSKSAPNENYPRELLQLFTIGLWELNQDGTLRLNAQNQPIPTYDQNTIKEFARALTGWTFPTKPGEEARDSNPAYFDGEMIPRVKTHDAGAKTLFGGTVLPAGQPAADDMEAVLDNIFHHRNLPPFVATRLIRSLVTSNPSPVYIGRVANVFANNGQGVRGDLKAVLTAILMDPEARTFSSEDGRLKDPILHVVGLGRALGAQMTDPNQFMYVFGNLSQRVLTPSTVFSFYSPLALLPGHTDLFGPEFQVYPPALAIQRANFTYGLLNGQFSTAFAFDLEPYKLLAGNPAALVEKVNQTLMFGRMSNELRELIVTATDAVRESDTRQRALGALYLAAISSEYSVYADNSGGAAETAVQPPTGLVVASVVGNLVTLRWKPPTIGPAPGGYIFEGGVHAGQVLASMPTGSASPTFTFAAPPGSFHLRIRSVSGAARSRASSEVRVYVNVPTAPTAPANLLGMVKGSTLGLSWRNTFGGGAPTSIVLDVTGPVAVSLPLGLTESLSVSGVPAGEYTLSVRAVNATGSSGSSNRVTLTFPTTCTGTPQIPTNFVASRTGNLVSLSWEAAASGAAATSYQVNVKGSFVAAIPVTARTVSGVVGRGTYEVSVQARNACGRSRATATQTITVR